ncbi:hypothetical protein AGMMS49936_02670 [Endomicrobiia bacterium]|nr:hypothetical protein AGMMS49936_02670 [Endomicrobiia bacterium]
MRKSVRLRESGARKGYKCNIYYKGKCLTTLPAAHAEVIAAAIAAYKRNADDIAKIVPEGKRCEWSYKEVLWAYIPEYDENDLMTCCFGGKIRGFDYDAWSPTAMSQEKGRYINKYRAYYKRSHCMP